MEYPSEFPTPPGRERFGPGPGDVEPPAAGAGDAFAHDPFDEAPDEPPPLGLAETVGDVQPWCTLLVTLAWGAMFALEAARHEPSDLAALTARGANVAPHGALDAAWRFLASTFLHQSPSHVFFNAVTWLVLGQAAERLFAPGALPLLYVLGGVAASWGSLAWRSQGGAPAGLSIGGSGVVFAIGGALLVAAFRVRKRLAVGRARAFGAVVLMLTLPALAAGTQTHGTDNAAHAAGLLAGLAVGTALPLREALGGPRRSTATAVAGVLAALAMGAALARSLAA